MPFLKFSRDKRGYEHFYLVQPSNRGKARPRVLYWFRTPPNIKVGRSPFDPEMRRAIEAQNPDVAFDWEAIVRTPIPPPMEPERWRERRRVERALRAEETEEAESITGPSEPESPAEIPAEIIQAIEEPAHEPLVQEAGEVSETGEPVVASNLTSPTTPDGGAPRHGRRRRRRRRGRRKPQQIQGSQVPGAEGSPEADVQESAPEGRKDEV
ncbi:MAG TPA: hypothetical protein VGJ39_05470 [Vicinamibacterales bacterium]